MPKRTTTVSLDARMRERLEATRRRLSHGSIVPSLGEVMREALAIGLDALEGAGADVDGNERGPRDAA